MALQNYNDLSELGSDLSAGFQFEFYCHDCPDRWRSDFTPYRYGQFAGLLTKFAFLLGNKAVTAGRATRNMSDMRQRQSHQAALEDAQNLAASRYTMCCSCKNSVCADCFESGSGSCLRCVKPGSQGGSVSAAGSDGQLCPNCSSANSGGRFCAECGFDMASTHKSCPGCGVMALREARFCPDCGHGF